VFLAKNKLKELHSVALIENVPVVFCFICNVYWLFWTGAGVFKIIVRFHSTSSFILYQNVLVKSDSSWYDPF